MLAFGGAVTLLSVLYSKRHTSVFLWDAAFFLALIIRECYIWDIEIGSPFLGWILKYFSETVIIQSFTITAIAFLFVPYICHFLSSRPKPFYFLPSMLVAVWVFILPMLRKITVFNSILYILPLELLYLGTIVWGLLRSGKSGNAGRIKKAFLTASAALAALAITEDILYALPWGFATIFANQYQPRNYSESAFYLAVAAVSIYSSACCFSFDRASAEKAPDNSLSVPHTENLAKPADFPLSAFSDSLGLTLRERDILSLLLSGKNNKEISDELFISIGTVKTHTHNIFQKANVEDRQGLETLAKEFLAR